MSTENFGRYKQWRDEFILTNGYAPPACMGPPEIIQPKPTPAVDRTKCRWMIHCKSGKTYTDRDALPSTVPAGEEITSVERFVNGRVVAVKASKAIHNIFVKACESKDLGILVDGSKITSLEGPTVMDALIVGFHVGEGENVHRVELVCDSHNGNVLCTTSKVKSATCDGF
jgi:hypothetical protein